MPVKLVADRCANEVSTVGIEPVPHHQIDMTEIHEAEVDRDLLALDRLRPDFLNLACHHPPAIHWDGKWCAHRRLQDLSRSR